MVDRIPEVQEPVEERPSPERIYSEQQVLQEEAIAHMPPLASLLLEKQYDLNYTIKVGAAIAVILVLYFLVGFDAVVTGLISFAIFFAFGYLVQSRNIDKDKTFFFETRKSGQIITPGAPGTPQYSRKFQVSFDRTALWAVPNPLLRKGLFKIPGEPINPLPGSSNWIYVDLFDERNGTVVLPRTPDVANISLDANMNPSLATQFDYQLQRVSELNNLERDTMDKWERKLLTTAQAQERLSQLRAQRQTLFGPGKEVKRDIFFSLQNQIPMLQDMLRVTRSSIITLANSMVAEIVYDLIHEPMPQSVKQNINKVRRKLNAPAVGRFSIDDLMGM